MNYPIADAQHNCSTAGGNRHWEGRMAKIMYTRLGSRIRRNEQTGSYSLGGSFTTLPRINAPISFVLLVFWRDTDETFQQSFAIVDGQGNLLDRIPTTECVLKVGQINTSTAFFHTAFSPSEQYSVQVYQNGVCTDNIPLAIAAPGKPGDTHPTSFAYLGNSAAS